MSSRPSPPPRQTPSTHRRRPTCSGRSRRSAVGEMRRDAPRAAEIQRDPTRSNEIRPAESPSPSNSKPWKATPRERRTGTGRSSRRSPPRRRAAWATTPRRRDGPIGSVLTSEPDVRSQATSRRRACLRRCGRAPSAACARTSCCLLPPRPPRRSCRGATRSPLVTQPARCGMSDV